MRNGQPRNKVIATKVTAADRAELEEMARAEGVTLSELFYRKVQELVAQSRRRREVYAA